MVVLVFEGLPGSGKSTSIEYLKKKYPKDVLVLRVLNEKGKEVSVEEQLKKDWDFFVKSDLKKLSIAKKVKNKIVLLDRWFPSTLSHAFARRIIDNSDIFYKMLSIFSSKLKIKEDIKFIYFRMDSKTSFKRRKLIYPECVWSKKPYCDFSELFNTVFFNFREDTLILNGKDNLNKNLKKIDALFLKLKQKYL